jgi:hypothetical protein
LKNRKKASSHVLAVLILFDFIEIANFENNVNASKMDNLELKLELHRIIDQVKDNRILQAIHTMLSSQVNVFAHTTGGKAITKEEFDMMLESSEVDIKAGRLTNQKDLKEEIKTWRRK